MVDQNVVTRIRKLLALAESPNVHEAALAAEKAQELIVKHNLPIAQIGQEPDRSDYRKHTKDLGVPKGQVTGWRRTLLFSIARNNFCRALSYEGIPRMALIGKAENIEMVEHLYDYLAVTIERLAGEGWTAAKRDNGGKAPWHYSPVTGEYQPQHAKNWKSAFCHGAVETVDRRMREFLRRQDSATMALVLVNETELDNAVATMIGGTRKGTVGVRPSDPRAYRAGAEAGEGIALNRPVRGGPARPNKQLYG